MKNQIFTCLLFICLFSATKQASACVVWQTGKMYIVDQYDNPVTNVKVWLYWTDQDSFIRKKYYHTRITDYPDTLCYVFKSNDTYRRSDKSIPAPSIFMRIQAAGFCDLIVKNPFNFKGNWGYLEKLPVLYVTMYPRTFNRSGDMIRTVDTYIFQKKLKIDSLAYIKLQDYEVPRSENAYTASNSLGRISAYPNPVTDNINLDFNLPITQPFSVKITDIQGKQVYEGLLNEQKNRISMEWQLAGIYIIQLYNPEGELLYALKFIKA